MGLSTSVHVGTYLECTMPAQQRTVEGDPVCARNKKHHVNSGNKFCPECGAKVDNGPRLETMYVTLTDVYNGDDQTPTDQGRGDRIRQLSEAGFEPICSEWVGNVRKTIDIVGFNLTSIDADNEGVHECDEMEHGFATPTQDQIDLLKKVVGYTSVKIKYGVLVQCA